LFLTHFSDMKLADPILRAVANQGYDTPTPIQEQTISAAIDGQDVLGCAQTGTGKTAAFALPIIQRLHKAKPARNKRGNVVPRALILAPTRELATQITESFNTYGRFTKLRSVTIYGGVSQRPQDAALRRGVDLIVATPGRLLDLMEQGLINFEGIQVLVLDEADRMLDMGFINPIRQIVKEIPSPRQTLLFSATMPREIKQLADSLLNKPIKITIKPKASEVPLIEQSLYKVKKRYKQSLLEHLIGEHEVERALVFTRTKHGADKVQRKLHKAGISSDSIHGNKSQNQRQRALDGFRNGKARVLVATDVAARGLDVDGITHVFNFDLPMEPEAYVHRIGRTGRAGATGTAIAFCDPDEKGLLRDIEKMLGEPVPLISDLPELPEPAPRENSHHHSDSQNKAKTRGNAPGGGRNTRRKTAKKRSTGNGSDNGTTNAGRASASRRKKRRSGGAKKNS